MKETLTELGIKYNTDKATFHKFTQEYDKHLSHLRDEKMNFLEVGIAGGNSLFMWRDYFSKSIIHGIDILDYSYINDERIKIYLGNQEKEEDLRGLPKNFDMIVDDGGHTMFQQQLTLKVLFLDHLKNEGIYILEDLHTSLYPYYHSHGSNEKNNTLNLLKDLQTGVFNESNGYHINEEDFNSLLSQIDYIKILDLGEYPKGEFHITSIIKKK